MNKNTKYRQISNYQPQYIVAKIFQICYSYKTTSLEPKEGIFMHDSFYNIWEQQQKIANIYNQIYMPELLKMQQTYSDIITQMQPTIDVVQNIAGLSTLAEQAMMIRNFDTDKFLSAWNNIIGIDNQFVQNMNSTLANMNVGQFVTMAQRMFFPTEAIVNYSQATSIAQMESIISNIYDTIQSIPDSVFDTLSDEEGYSKEEIQEELEVMRAEGFAITDIEGLTPDQVQEKMWMQLWEKCPTAAHVLVMLLFAIGITANTIDSVNTIKEIFLPIVQNTIVKLQGKEEIFFVKVESAKLYTEPNSHSKVITKILYAEEVTWVESIKLWDKVIYINPDGEEITGWIAKRNVMLYKDYEFNSDELYEIN